MSVRRVVTFEEPVRKLGARRGFIDLLWKGVLLVEQKSAGGNLIRAKEQAQEYFPGLSEAELPRFLLVSDFRNFELFDLDNDEEAHFTLDKLSVNIEKFGFIIGRQKPPSRDQAPVNIQASELVGRVHDGLAESGYTGHDLERFLVRIVFCLFADDTGIFEPRDRFLDLLENRTTEDGANLGQWLSKIFQELNTPPEERQTTLDEDLAGFPHVNGALFDGALKIPDFNSEMRRHLIAAGQFDWSGISPAIFGALFQSVMDKKQRREQGAHYTTEENIMKVIEPLFLNDLRDEFARLKVHRGTRRERELRAFHRRLAEMRFFDPACGCGNFLIIAYREMRALEIELLREIRAIRDVGAGPDELLDVGDLTLLNVDQYYGIEIEEFPARIAETALWMMDHIMNLRLGDAFGQSFVRIPLKESPHIHHADALEMDWAGVLPPADNVILFGNPPFGGAKFQSPEQRAQVRRLAGLGGGGGTLDYATAWFILAADYSRRGGVGFGFVATNSITQGEQVAQLWPILFDKYGMEIAFAHRSFAWGSEARGKAHVHVVIIGLARRAHAPAKRLLFSYAEAKGEPDESDHTTLSPYLIDAQNLANPHVVIHEAARPLNGLPPLRIGSKPIDGGHYIFTDEERAAFLAEEPGAEKFLHPFIGAREFIQGGRRWILALQNAEPGELRALPAVMARMRAVREFRGASRSKPTQTLAATPTLYHVNIIPEAPFLALPEVSSERRDYAPMGWLEPPVIPSNKIRILENASLPLFGLLTSAMHMAWLRYFGGRMKSDYSYGIGITYNTFPLPPDFRGNAEASLEAPAQAVLDARAAHPDASLADLYDPDAMPADLRTAHRNLDRAVDRLYRRKTFDSDRQRAEYLLTLYEAQTNPIRAAVSDRPKRRRRRPQPKAEKT